MIFSKYQILMLCYYSNCYLASIIRRYVSHNYAILTDDMKENLFVRITRPNSFLIDIINDIFILLHFSNLYLFEIGLYNNDAP